MSHKGYTLALLIRYPFSSLDAAIARVPNHNFLLETRADWLKEAHTPDTPTLNCLLRFLAFVPGLSAQAIRGLNLCYATVHTCKHPATDIKKNTHTWTHYCWTQRIRKRQTRAVLQRTAAKCD